MKDETLLFLLAHPRTDPVRLREYENQPAEWRWLVSTAAANRLDSLVFTALDRLGWLDRLPPLPRMELKERHRRTMIKTRAYLDLAGEIGREFERRGVNFVVLRGLDPGISLYGTPYLRPFQDLDLLVAGNDVSAARDALSRMGFVSPPGLLPESYFLHHHLHLQLGNKARGATVELHWALDHPYTLYLVDYPGILSRRREASFSGVRIPVPSPADRVLMLCLHLFKHCPFLPALAREDDFPGLLLRGNWALWLLDIHLAATDRDPEPDWEDVRKLADAWNLRREAAACLEAAGRIYGGHGLPLPFPRQRGGESGMNFAERFAARAQISSLRPGAGSGARCAFLFRLRPDTVFRPLRALDAIKYLFPPPGYVRQKYRASGARLFAAYARHQITALRSLLANAAACAYRPKQRRAAPPPGHPLPPSGGE